jgi:hypothetical protein
MSRSRAITAIRGRDAPTTSQPTADGVVAQKHEHPAQRPSVIHMKNIVLSLPAPVPTEGIFLFRVRQNPHLKLKRQPKILCQLKELQ